jgi:hypothetical protein
MWYDCMNDVVFGEWWRLKPPARLKSVQIARNDWLAVAERVAWKFLIPTLTLTNWRGSTAVQHYFCNDVVIVQFCYWLTKSSLRVKWVMALAGSWNDYQVRPRSLPAEKVCAHEDEHVLRLPSSHFASIGRQWHARKLLTWAITMPHNIFRLLVLV